MRSNNHSAVAAFAGLLGFAVILHGCADFSGACTDELRVHLSPSDTTVAVGSTFQPVIVLSTCGARSGCRIPSALKPMTPRSPRSIPQLVALQRSARARPMSR
jgi:hypothetical protein